MFTFLYHFGEITIDSVYDNLFLIILQLEAFCGPPKFLNNMARLKVWEKPAVTSYEGDFSGDLRQLVVNLELKISGFYSDLYSLICASEPDSGSGCWDGLTERYVYTYTSCCSDCNIKTLYYVPLFEVRQVGLPGVIGC